MTNLSKVIKDCMCITVEDVRYFLSQNTDSKVLYRNRFDLMIIKGNKVLTIPGNAHEYQHEAYGGSKRSSLPGIYPYCQEINNICPSEDIKLLECIVSHLTSLPVEFMVDVPVDTYVDLYDTPITIYSKNKLDFSN